MLDKKKLLLSEWLVFFVNEVFWPNWNISFCPKQILSCYFDLILLLNNKVLLQFIFEYFHKFVQFVFWWHSSDCLFLSSPQLQMKHQSTLTWLNLTHSKLLSPPTSTCQSFSSSAAFLIGCFSWTVLAAERVSSLPLEALSVMKPSPEPQP